MTQKRFGKGAGIGMVKSLSNGNGSVVASSTDRRPSGGVTHAAHILERQHAAELRLVLNGDCERTLYGFHAATDADDSRALYVPFHVTTCPVLALIQCRERGLLRSKLDAMSAEDAAYFYSTTLATKPEGDN
jgi:hypothetical protein